jgi:acyl-coenzyme A synthetase/AMP-(fatty) acid ligase
MRACWLQRAHTTISPISTRTRWPQTFYTTGTTGNPKGVYFTHAQLVLHTMSMATTMGGLDSIRLLGNDDVYMPITPMFHVHAWGVPYVATMLGVKQVYPGRYEPDMLCRTDQGGEGQLLPLRPDHPADGAGRPWCAGP